MNATLLIRHWRERTSPSNFISPSFVVVSARSNGADTVPPSYSSARGAVAIIRRTPPAGRPAAAALTLRAKAPP
jgi:hypothetical protein